MKQINLADKDPLLYSILIFLFSWFSGCVFATERIAYRFMFSPELGKSFYHLYNPFDFWFWFKVFSRFPAAKSMMLNSILDGALVSLGLWFFLTFLRGKLLGKVNAPDELSHFANRKEIDKMGLFSETGIMIGRYVDHQKHFIFFTKTIERYLRFDSNTHILYFAPTRSGKGVGFVIPNLLSYPHSCIVNDLKRENYDLTAGYREKELHQKIYYFNPTDIKSHIYNPLDFIRAGAKEAVKDAQTIANIIVSDPAGTSASSSHWDNTARALLTGLILFVSHNYPEGDEMRSIGGIYRLMSSPTSPQIEILDTIRTTAKHAMAARAAAIILNKEEAERSGIISTMTRYLELWADPLVHAVTSGKSSFSIYGMRKDPSTLYMATPTSDIDRTKPLIRIMLTQFTNLLGEKLPGKNDKWQEILFLLDEFPRLGKIEAIEGGLPLLAGYGVKFALITQDLNQLNKVYTKENEVMANAQLKVTYAASDPETAEKISKYLGETTVLKQGTSFSGKRFGSMLNQASYSTSEQDKALLTPGQLQQLPYNEAIVILTGHLPIKCEKIIYYKEDFFKGKFGLKVPDTGMNHQINLEIRTDAEIEKSKKAAEDAKASKNKNKTTKSNISQDAEIEEAVKFMSAEDFHS